MEITQNPQESTTQVELTDSQKELLDTLTYNLLYSESYAFDTVTPSNVAMWLFGINAGIANDPFSLTFINAVAINGSDSFNAVLYLQAAKRLNLY